MRHLLLISFVVFLAGCQSMTVEQDPSGRLLPQGTVTAIHRYFAPEAVPYASSVSIVRVQSMPDFMGLKSSGGYIPFTKTIIVSEESKSIPVTVVHEILHVFYWMGKVPNQAGFARNLKRFLKDPRYSKQAAFLNSQWKDYEKSWLYPKSMRLHEYYAYLGQSLMDRSKVDCFGLPPYMEEHFRGIFHSSLYFDHRFYNNKNRPHWEGVGACYRIGSRVFYVKAPWRDHEAMVRYGGVIQLTSAQQKPAHPIEATIVKIGEEQVTQGLQVRIPARTHPLYVDLLLFLPAEAPLAQEKKIRTIVLTTKSGLILNILYPHEMNFSASAVENARMRWEEASLVYKSYISRNLVVRVDVQRVAIQVASQQK